MVFAVYENSPANGVIIVVPNDVGAFLRNLWRRDLRCEFVRFPVVATAQNIFQSVFCGIVCIPYSLERCCRGAVLAAVKVCFALARVDGAAISVLAVVFAKNNRCRIHVGAPAFCSGLCAHDGVQEDDFCAAPGTTEIKSLVETRIADFDDGVVENVTPCIRILRSGNVAAVSRHHEFCAFEENVAATADKVYSSVDFAAFPVGAAFLGVVSVLTAQEAYVLVDELVARILLQGDLSCGVR